MSNGKKSKVSLALVVGALGIVYGDIGTSPLYALKEAFFGIYHLERSPENVLGLLSLFFWSLMIIVTIKYIGLIMRADNQGEGGIFALLALIRQGRAKKFVSAGVGVAILIGAALLYGDGVITPAISVLSAVEGLNVVTSGFSSLVVPITVVILIGLFSIQKRGSGKVGSLFGPIMIVWFLVLAALGLPQIVLHPEVLGALSPLPAIHFIAMYGWGTMLFLGAVVLCVTGAEALYADMGHFGRRSITTAWLGLVYPALAINYFGQGARLLSPGEIPNEHLFYSLAPDWALVPLVILSTVATIIASQALISGAFSLSNQAIALGIFPRLKTIHTNAKVEGQIYMPFINLALLVGCIFLVINFKTSGALAAAYGIAVTGTMGVTTIAFYLLARYQWRWPLYIVGPIGLCLLFVDVTFFAANLLKVTKGGYIPLIIATALFFIMHAWQWGRRRIAHAYAELPGLTVAELIEAKHRNPEHMLHRSVVVMASRPTINIDDRIPVALDSFCHKWGSAIPKHVIFFNVSFVNKPRVGKTERYKIKIIHDDPIAGTVSFVQVIYGYMQTPVIRDVLEELKEKRKIHIPADPSKWLVLAGAERFVSRPRRLLDRVRLAVFRSIMTVSKPVTSYLGLGSDSQVAIETINI